MPGYGLTHRREWIDTGLLCDFMSSKLVDQLHLDKIELETPLSVQLVVQGSHSKVNYSVKCSLKYQHINEAQTLI
jgi:hypothetical protein